MHVFWNFQIQRLLGPQLMCWSHCFIELEATASNTLNIKHHQWINSVQQNIKSGIFISVPCLHTRIVFPMPSKGGGAERAVCLHCIGGSPPTCCVIMLYLHRCIIAARFHYLRLYHCSVVSLFVSFSVVEGSLTSSFIPSSVPGSGRIFCICVFCICILLFCIGIFIIVLLRYCVILFLYFVFVFHYHCWPSSVVVS